jgi:hypothetical protein
MSSGIVRPQSFVFLLRPFVSFVANVFLVSVSLWPVFWQRRLPQVGIAPPLEHHQREERVCVILAATDM